MFNGSYNSEPCCLISNLKGFPYSTTKYDNCCIYPYTSKEVLIHFWLLVDLLQSQIDGKNSKAIFVPIELFK